MIESFESRLIDFLIGIPAMGRRETRNLLLENLPSKPISTMLRDDALRQDLFQIVNSIIQFGQLAGEETFAIEILIRNIRPFVEGLSKENYLNALLQEFQKENQNNGSHQSYQSSQFITGIKIPFVILSMTLNEAKELKDELDSIDESSRNELNAFQDLMGLLKSYGVAEFTEYYGQNREDWRPYTCLGKTIKEIVLEVVNQVNECQQQQENNPPLFQPYFVSTDCFESDFSRRAKAWHQLRQIGCVIIVDSISLFHPDIRDRFSRAEISSNTNVSILTLSPVDPCVIEANKILEQLVVSQMEPAFLRFEEHMDKRCEIGVGDLRSIRRWFFQVLPETVEILSRQKAQPENRRALREIVGPRNKLEKLWTGGNV